MNRRIVLAMVIALLIAISTDVSTHGMEPFNVKINGLMRMATVGAIRKDVLPNTLFKASALMAGICHR